MDNKSLECFACDGRARGLRIEVSPQDSFVLPHEHFVYSEFKAGEQRDSLRITFVAHEVVLEGFLLRRIENAIVNRDLAWLCARGEKFRPQNHERPFVTKLIVRALETTTPVSEKSERESL